MDSLALLERIRRYYPVFSPSERAVADFVCNHYTQIARMSIGEIKKMSGISEPTVYRFCKAIGFGSFREFKISLAEQTASFHDYFTTEPTEGKPRLEKLVERLLLSERDAVNTTLKMLDYAALEKASVMVKEAGKICLFGCSTSYDICRDLQRRLARLGLIAFMYCDIHDAAVQLTRFSEKDVLICVSQYGNTRETVESASIARQNGVKVITITTNLSSRIVEYSTLILRTFAPEVTGSRLGITTRTAQYAVADALYMAVASLMGDKIEELMESSMLPLIHR